MGEITRIRDISQHVGEQITLQGWLHHRTDKGKLQFLQVRDGTGFVQCVVFRKEVSPEVFEAAAGLTQESSLTVTGIVREDARAHGIPGGYELGVSDLQVHQVAQDYPIQPKEHGVGIESTHCLPPRKAVNACLPRVFDRIRSGGDCPAPYSTNLQSMTESSPRSLWLSSITLSVAKKLQRWYSES